jgi:hypothetical protein
MVRRYIRDGSLFRENAARAPDCRFQPPIRFTYRKPEIGPSGALRALPGNKTAACVGTQPEVAENGFKHQGPCDFRDRPTGIAVDESAFRLPRLPPDFCVWRVPHLLRRGGDDFPRTVKTSVPHAETFPDLCVLEGRRSISGGVGCRSSAGLPIEWRPVSASGTPGI